MRKLLSMFVAVISMKAAHTQNIGIGTTNPTIKLDVSSPTSFVARFNSNTSQLRVLFSENDVFRGYIGSYSGGNEDLDIGTMETNNTGKLNLTTKATPRMTIDESGNIGIGTNVPGFKVDVVGRMRLQQAGASTAGIWFDGPATETRAFIGMVNDDHVGIYGNGAGWNIAMNAENGNTGIGTSTPTAKLDVNGDIRIRGSVPQSGSVLSSIDANGNARWADPIAFRAVGGLNGQPNTLNDITWQKIFFNQTPNYNRSLNYQPLLSQFVASESGIYHFDASLDWDEYYYNTALRIMINRGGTILVLAEVSRHSDLHPTEGQVLVRQASAISIDGRLFAGDIVWIEGFADVAPAFGTTTTVSASGNHTWFSGHLVARD